MKTNYRLAIYDVLTTQFVGPTQRFFQKEVASSILLVCASIFAIFWINAYTPQEYDHFWHLPIQISFGQFALTKSLTHWINDGLMAIFFFTVGLEIKREIIVGELSTPQKALLPVCAAFGGMVVPGCIYFLFTFNTQMAGGWAIPMATDIAFALGAIAVLGNRLPTSLRIFLAAFAIADDLGAVIIIAIFYTHEIMITNLIICFIIILILGMANYLWIRTPLFYAIMGIVLWLFIMGSGLHPTIAGVILAMFIPAQAKYNTDQFIQNVQKRLKFFDCKTDGCGESILLNDEHLNAVQNVALDCQNVETPLQRMLYILHPWVAFWILPLFALANSGISFGSFQFDAFLSSPLSWAIIIGLALGKPVGILLFSQLAVKLKIATLPKDVCWPQIIGASMFGGIGFTMSLFVTNLSFADDVFLNTAKISIFIGSLLSTIVGFTFLHIYLTKERSIVKPTGSNHAMKREKDLVKQKNIR